MLCVIGLFSCTTGSEDNSEKLAIAETRILGDSISSLSQSVFMQQVMQAMEQGGTEYAIDFCHLKASHITDSLSTAHKVSIQRISDKNRNPENALQSAEDKRMFAYYQGRIAGQQSIADTLIQDGNQLVYYKPIQIGMPACLKCHGKEGLDIDPAVLKSLQTQYPEDKARNYEMQALRGMWKLVFPKS